MGGFLKGALVELIPTALVPIPNVIVFQFNPETMTHTWTQPEPPPAGEHSVDRGPYAVAHEPGETFGLTLTLDANDSIATGSVSGGLAVASGVYSRLAALEMLLYPGSSTAKPLSGKGGGLLGTVTAAIGSAVGAKANASVPDNVLNTVLFVWGPGRIVPVRITGLTVTEKLYDTLLNPTFAEVQVSMRVPTNEELRHGGATVTAATVANTYTQSLRQARAVANLANATESVIGLLPF